MYLSNIYSMEQDKKFFYIFIDIKGALYTADWVKFIQAANLCQDDQTYAEELDKQLHRHAEWKEYYTKGLYTRSKHIRKICPYNVMSLNDLIFDLQFDYNVNLVITTPKWKEYFDLKTLPALVRNGLNFKDIIIDKTPNINDDRAAEISKYLTQVGNPSNYLIIDSDEAIKRQFGEDKVMIVDKYHTGLNKAVVDQFLDDLDEAEYVNQQGNDLILNDNLVNAFN